MRPSFPFSQITVHNGRETSCPETGWGLTHTGSGGTMPRWLILLIAVLVVLVIAILVAEHVHVGVH